MKILHTSDWHIGKRLPPFSREEEQKEALAEICEIARRENVDVCLIAGDVFDVSVPPASAEEIFYRAALELSRQCLVVAIAGNHDDGQRLKAPDALAKASGIILAGGFDSSALSCENVQAHRGGIVYRKGGERLNLLLCPYLTESRRGDPPASDFSAYVREVLKEAADDVFSSDGCNVTVAHLFMLGSSTLGEERELGAAKLLPMDVLPKCDYVALGHVHKPMRLAENVYYPGSILGYSFENNIGRRVLIFDTQTKEVRSVPLSGGYPLLTAKVRSFEQALAFLQENENAYVKIVYDSPTPLFGGQVEELKSSGKLAVLDIVPQGEKREIVKRAHRTSAELFEEFFERTSGSKPSDSLMKEFLELMGENA